jgi:hypothetical protein
VSAYALPAIPQFLGVSAYALPVIPQFLKGE